MTPIDARTPVHVITGFLGSGKTTLLQALLADAALADTAVIINELGEIALDHLLVSEVAEGAVVLRNGCVCCTIRTDLAETLRALQSGRAAGSIPPFVRVVLETTGIADPLPIIATLSSDPVLRHQFRLGAVVATIDGVNGLAQLESQPESVKQAATADRLVLTKTDLANDPVAHSRLSALRAALARINPTAPILDATAAGGGVADLLLGGGLSDDAGRQAEIAHWLAAEHLTHAHGPAESHAGSVNSFCLRFERPMDWTAFGVWLTMLLHRHGDRVLRVKGLLNVEGAAAPVVIHGVQQIVHPPLNLAAWPDADHDSRIVFIVRGLEPALIERSMRAFLGQRSAVNRSAA